MNEALHRQLDAIEEQLSQPSTSSAPDMASWCERLYGRQPDTLPAVSSSAPTSSPVQAVSPAPTVLLPRGWWDVRRLLLWARAPYRRPPDLASLRATQAIVRRAWLWRQAPPLGPYGGYLVWGFLGLLGVMVVAAQAPSFLAVASAVGSVLTLGLGTLWKRLAPDLRHLRLRAQAYERAWIYEEELNVWLQWPSLAKEVERLLRHSTKQKLPLLEGDRQILTARSKQLDRNDRAARLLARVATAAQRS